MDLSIIVPVYNVEEFLKECVESLLEIKEINLEILLLNDGSTDNSAYLCDRFSEVDNRIRVIHKNNSGLSATRNLGIKIAKGEFLTFVDSDDFINSNLLGILVREMKKNNLDIIRGRFEKFNSVKEIENLNDNQFNQSMLSETMNGIEYIEKTLSNNSYEIVTCTSIYRKEYLVNKELYFSEGLYFEDHEFTFKTLLNIDSKIMIYDENPYYYYRQREGSITNSADYSKLKSFIFIIEKQIEHLSLLSDSREKKNAYRLILLTLDHLIQFSQHNLSVEEQNKIRYKLKRVLQLKKISELKLFDFRKIKSSYKAQLYFKYPRVLNYIYSKKGSI